jgi:putative NADPH-quinone reductase
VADPTGRRILVINGHPDPSPERLCGALADAYARAASAAGHRVDRLDVGALEFPFIRSMADYQTSASSPDIDRAQAAIRQADLLVIVFPLWFGSIPAYLKGFFEQVLRYGFALSTPQAATSSLLTGKAARLIVTMGMPLTLFRWVLGGYGLKSLERGLFWVSGVSPIRHTLFGQATTRTPAQVQQWISQVEALGARGD